MKASITMLSAAAVAVGVLIVQAAPVLITTAPQLSLVVAPLAAVNALHSRHEVRLDARTNLPALDEMTNKFADRIDSPVEFDLGAETEKMGEPMGLPKNPRVYGWSKEEMAPFRATPYSASAHQVHAPSEASAGSLEAHISHELSLAPKRQLSFRDSASQPSSPAHEGDDHGKHAPLDALSPKLLSIKEPALGDIPGKHVTNSRTTSAHAETSHSERTETGDADASNNEELSGDGFTEKEEREIEAWRRAHRQLEEASFKMKEKEPLALKLKITDAWTKEYELARGDWNRAVVHRAALRYRMSEAQFQAAEQREKFWRRYWSNRLKSHNDIDPDYLRIYARREHPMHMLLFAHTYRPREAQSGHQGEPSRRY